MSPESLAGLTIPSDLVDAVLAAPAVRPGALDDAPHRTLEVAWEDPLETVARAHDLSGREYLEALRDGELPAPPMARLLGIELVDVGDGTAAFAVNPGEQHYNPIGLVHGGLAATLLDSALGCAIHSTLPRGAAYSTIELKVNFVRPVTRDTGRVRCEASVVHRGGRIATAEGRVVSEQTGKLLAHGSTTCLIDLPATGALGVVRPAQHARAA